MDSRQGSPHQNLIAMRLSGPLRSADHEVRGSLNQGVLTEVMNTLLDECVKSRNPNEVSQQVNLQAYT